MRQFTQVQTVQTAAQFSHFSTSVRLDIHVHRHARGRHTSSKIVDAIRHSTATVLVVRLWCIDLTLGLAVDVGHISMISVVVVDVRAVVVSITQPVAVSTDTVTYPQQELHRCRTFNIKYAKLRRKKMQNYA